MQALTMGKTKHDIFNVIVSSILKLNNYQLPRKAEEVIVIQVHPRVLQWTRYNMLN